VVRRVNTEAGLHRLDKENPRVRAKNVNPDDSVGARPVHAVDGTGMDGFEVNPAQLRQTDQDLARLHDTLREFMEKSTTLAEPLMDGHSPVAKHMQRAFFERADLDGGVYNALKEYMRELFSIRLALQATLNSYQALDAGAVERLNRQMAELEGAN